MPNYNSNIEIDKNSICYRNEVLNISNISRTWIFKFENKEKKAYEVAKEKYELLKLNHESYEKYKKKSDIKKYSIMCILVGIFAIHLSRTTLYGLWALAISIIFGFLAVKSYKKDIKYDKEPPVEKKVPNKFGLGIQMNSGYVTIFTAEGKEGVVALRKLQEDIKNVDIHNGKTVFNMNEYNVKVEGDVDGIVNFGDDNININNGEELLNV